MSTGNVTSNITITGADYMASCKLLGELLHFHIKWDFVNDIFINADKLSV